jgi:hypothetical protein
MSNDDSIHDELAELPVPPESPQFFDDLWRRANERERARARRWRRTALALAVVALGAVASAAVLATSTGAATNVADVRGSCVSSYQGGFPVVTAHGETTDKPQQGVTLPTPPPGFKPVQGLWIDTPGGKTFLTLSPFSVGFTVDRRLCTAYKKRIDLGHKGLGAPETYHQGDYTYFEHRCLDVARIAFRVRVEMDQNGQPTRAQLAIVRAKTGVPLMYVDWTADKVVGYAAKRCPKSGA